MRRYRGPRKGRGRVQQSEVCVLAQTSRAGKGALVGRDAVQVRMLSLSLLGRWWFPLLVARAIGHAGSTRHYLKGINQDSYQLPEGPVIMSPDRLFTFLHREVIMRRPEVFKMA